MPPHLASERPSRVKRLGVAAAPALLATALVGASLAIRVTTPVSVDVVAGSVAFTVSSGAEGPVQLLNNLTAFSSLVIEGCATVTFPPMTIGVEDAPGAASSGPVTFRCDPRMPGSKLIVRMPHGPAAPGDLGSIDSLLAGAGERVVLELTSARPPGIRLEKRGDVVFDVSLRRDVPFEIVAEFAEVDGVPSPVDPDGVTLYRARLSDAAPLRHASVRAGRRLNVVVEPAGDPDTSALFVTGLNVPVEAISFVQRSDVRDRLESTAVKGTLHYTGTAAESVPIDAGDNVRFPEGPGFRLTGLGVDRESAGLALRVEGDAARLSTGAEDRRLRLFDVLVSDRTNAIAGAIALVVSQLVWLRDLWWPGRARRDEEELS